MNICTNINPNIFRAYDIRAIYEKELTGDIAYTIGRAFASYISEMGLNNVIVGHDNRNSYKTLYPALKKGLIDSGVNVIDLGLVMTPMLNFAKIYTNIGPSIMLTASHNPKEYNGFKMSIGVDDSLYGNEIIKFKEYLEKYKFKSGHGSEVYLDIEEEYLKCLKQNIKLGQRKLKVVVDTGNGTGSVFIKKILDMFDITYELLFAESDSNFPNHVPDPAVKENMQDLGKKVVELGYDVGLALDGDCDRCGVVLENGKFIAADLIMLIFYRNLANTMKTKKAIFDVKCSKSLIDEIEKLKLTPVMNRTGSVYCRDMVKKLNLDFGGEYSGHIFFRDRYLGYDDGVYGILRFIELLSNTDKKVSELLDGINKYYSTEEIKINVKEENKFSVVKKIENYVKSNNYKYADTDGIRVIFDDGFALIRASNTGPNLTVRFEAKTKDRLKEIEDEFMQIIEKENF